MRRLEGILNAVYIGPRIRKSLLRTKGSLFGERQDKRVRGEVRTISYITVFAQRLFEDVATMRILGLLRLVVSC